MPCLLPSLGKNRAVCGRYTALESCSSASTSVSRGMRVRISWGLSLSQAIDSACYTLLCLILQLSEKAAHWPPFPWLFFKIQGLKLKESNSRCLKITEKVSFNIASEAKLCLHFEWTKVNLKMAKIVHSGEFLKTWSLRTNSVTRQVTFNITKIGGKCQN